MNADLSLVTVRWEEEEGERLKEKLRNEIKIRTKLYDDLKTAYYMMQKRLEDRINFLKDANGTLTAAKVDVDKELLIVAGKNCDLWRDIESIAIKGTTNARVEILIRQKDRDLEICAHELCALRKEKHKFYDMAADAQMYGILVARLLKSFDKGGIVWPHRPFEVSLLGIKE